MMSFFSNISKIFSVQLRFFCKQERLILLDASGIYEFKKNFPENTPNIDLSKPVIILNPRFVKTFLRFRMEIGNQGAYVLAYSVAHRCKVIATPTDNFNFLASINSRNPDCRVISVQIGQRPDNALLEVKKIISGKEECEAGLLHDILLTWGQYDEDRLSRLEIKAKEIYVVGSLRDFEYRRSRSKEGTVSTIGVSFLKLGMLDDIPSYTNFNPTKQSAEFLLESLSRFCKDNDLKPMFILRPGDPKYISDQIEYIGQVYSGDWTVNDQEPDYPSYSAAYNCDLLLGIRSSLLFEALANGRKVLGVNMTDDASMDICTKGPWQMNRPTYKQFEFQVKNLLETNQEDWLRILGTNPAYFLSQDERSAPDKVLLNLVRKHVDK
jgi:surface carbohydrate biosynthesis protein